VYLAAAFAASVVTRTCSKRAFEKHHRGTVASDLLKEIDGVFYDFFDKS
jgi:NAD(P)H-hydrate repair Nnr-like enzyme with NAD(P)H-hydrate dehydratase domain